MLGTSATREFEHWESPDGNVLLVRGDCLSVLPTLEAGSVDLLLTDPPYMNLVGGYSFSDLGGVANRAEESFSLGDEWNASLEWIPLAIPAFRLGAIVFTTYHGLPEVAIAFNGLRRAALITWHKRNAPCTGKNVPRFTEEYA